MDLDLGEVVIREVSQSEETEIAVDQFRSISKKRLIEKIADLHPEEALQLRLLISEMYGESGE